MEALGAFSDAEWDSFTAFFSSHELDHALLPLAANAASTDLQPTDHGGSGFLNSTWFYSLDSFDPSLQSAIKQDMSCSSCSTDSSSSFVFANSSDMFMSMDEKSFGSSFFSDVLMEEVDKSLCAVDEDDRRERFENVQDCQPLPQVAGKKLIPSKRKQEEPKPVTEGDGKVNNSAFSDNEKKKTALKNKKSRGSKKTQNRSVEEEGNAAACDGQSSISCSSEEENENGSQEGNGVSTTSSEGKRRASRGSATDPQSLYARKRRERINERLKMLQRLVPNGTKVDISTMLEEAVHYVKFLQLQIKLLSSDEMWMFAPLAYNGMDIGLHPRLSPFLSN